MSSPLIKNPIYNWIKKQWYRYAAYYTFKPKWDLGNGTVSILINNKRFEFVLDPEESTTAFIKPIYLSYTLNFLKHELFGYFYQGALPPPGMVLDVGACHGIFGAYLSKISKEYEVLSFEPDPQNILLMKRNYEINHLHTNIIEKAVWNKEESLRFNPGGGTGNISINGDLAIRATDLDSELTRRHIPFDKVSFVKMDIEGAEIEAIDGMKELLTTGSPHLAIATYHVRNGEQTYKIVEDKLQDLGYTVKTGYPKHLTTWAWKSAI